MIWHWHLHSHCPMANGPEHLSMFMGRLGFLFCEMLVFTFCYQFSVGSFVFCLLIGLWTSYIC